MNCIKINKLYLNILIPFYLYMCKYDKYILKNNTILTKNENSFINGRKNYTG